MKDTDLTNPEAVQNSEAEIAAEAAVATTTVPADAAIDTATDVEAMLAEAEQRGYLRGRNEAIAEQIDRPGLWEETDSPKGVSILDNISPGILD